MRDAAELCCKMLSAVEDMHDKGYLHRDIKPVTNRALTSRADDSVADFSVQFCARCEQRNLHT